MSSFENLNAKSVALISMPWMAPSMPSIQLATISAALNSKNISNSVFELFLDYANVIGLNLYEILCNLGGFIEEWIFANHYFDTDLSSFRKVRPDFGFGDEEDGILDALLSITGTYLDDLVSKIDWAKYDIIGFSLSISQTAASMALSKKLKEKYPNLIIVFGGSACAGPMGPAILKTCDEVDAVVSIEGEEVFPEIVSRLRSAKNIENMAGVHTRKSILKDSLISEEVPLISSNVDNISYSAYFERAESLGLLQRMTVWVPFESSRGCWWGEKSQCTFCGLHEIMKFRSFAHDKVLKQLDALSDENHVNRFFAVDLIMPLDFNRTFLPEIAKSERDWEFFYEIKANVKRKDLKIMSDAGVVRIQPGLESLSTDVLKLMKKGTTKLQNIQLLKWCRELGIDVAWNIITDIPGENTEYYTGMDKTINHIKHFQPPTGANPFQMHRFSPYFDNPEDYGLKLTGPHPLYRYVFPVEQDVLDDLVFLYQFEFISKNNAPFHGEIVSAWVDDWTTAYKGGAMLILSKGKGKTFQIKDSRNSELQITELSEREGILIKCLDPAVSFEQMVRLVNRNLDRVSQSHYSDDDLTGILNEWESKGWIIRENKKIFSLVIAEKYWKKDIYEITKLPVPYLESAL